MPKVTRETPLTSKTKDGHILTEQETLFCEMYVINLGNGTEAALEAYDIDTSKVGYKNTAKSIACENLRKPYILVKIREILDLSELNDETVDTELNFLVKQSSDLHAKKGGIDIYNKIKGRYADTTIKHKFEGISDEELEERLAKEIAEIIGNDGGIREKKEGESS